MSISSAFLIALAVILTLLFVVGIAAARGNNSAFALLRRAVDVERSEVSAMLISAVYFFCTLTTTAMLRPVRDEIAAASGVRDLPKLYLTTLLTMLVIAPLYGGLVARFPVRRFVRFVYQFIAINLVAFFIAWRIGVSPIAMQWVFFSWHAAVTVFAPSLFWSVMADTFSATQSKRVFGFIGVGGTIGAITGLSITGFFTAELGRTNLLLVAASLILIAAILAQLVPQAAAATDTLAAERKQTEVIGGSPIAGAIHVLKSPYLAAIAAFLFLYVFGSTILYAAQTQIIGDAYTDRAQRTEVLAQIELGAQILAAFGQVFLTARMMRSFGLAVTIAAVPVVSIFGFAALGATAMGLLPLLTTFVVFNIARRASEFMLTQPSRKVLFTVLTREDKYKTTNFLETFVYRAGDQLSATAYAGLIALGLVLADIAWLAVPVSIAYLIVAVWLARRHREMAAAQLAREPQPAVAVAR
jgi:ATP:ADP antiporter, AAA family